MTRSRRAGAAVACVIMLCGSYVRAWSGACALGAKPTFHYGLLAEPPRHRLPRATSPLALWGVPPACATLEVTRYRFDPGVDSGWIEVNVGNFTVREGTIRLHGEVGHRTLLIAACSSGTGYFMHGPFRWPARPSRVEIDSTPRRSVVARAPWELDPAARPHWLTSGPRTGAAPEVVCRRLAGWMECLGVAVSDAGVVLVSGGRRSFSGVVLSGETSGSTPIVQLLPHGWGRLLVTSRPVAGAVGREPSPVGIVRRRPLRRGVIVSRVSFEAYPGAHAVALAPAVFWVTGDDMTPGQYLQLAEPDRVVLRIVADGWIGGPPEIPAFVDLPPGRVLEGRIVSSTGLPVAEAFVSVSEVGSPNTLETDGEASVPTLWTVAELRSDEDGRFHLAGLGPAEYEVFALHAYHGRVRERLVASGRLQTLRLRVTRRVKGRVLSQGRPMAGLPVGLFPALEQMVDAPDPLDYVTRATWTDDTGRFEVALPPRGRVSLRIGESRRGVTRISLVSSDTERGVLDLGDIELSPPVKLVVTLAPELRCPVSVVGPVGVSGVSIVEPVGESQGALVFELPEPGRWMLWAQCGERELSVVPSFVDVAGAGSLAPVFLQPLEAVR